FCGVLCAVLKLCRVLFALVGVCPHREDIAVKEAQRMGVTTVALIDTDSDPDTVDLPIPGNDDSIRSIELMLAKLADAVLEGRASLPPEPQKGGSSPPGMMVKPHQPRPTPTGNGANAGQASPKPASAAAQ